MHTNKVIAIINDICNFSGIEVKPEHRLMEDLGATDTDIEQAIAELEDEFGIAIQRDVTSIQTVSDAIALVQPITP